MQLKFVVSSAQADSLIRFRLHQYSEKLLYVMLLLENFIFYLIVFSGTAEQFLQMHHFCALTYCYEVTLTLFSFS